MAIAFAPMEADIAGLSGRFALPADGYMSELLLREAIEDDSDADQAKRGNADRFNLNPPQDTLESKLNRIIALMTRGEPGKALEKIEKLVNDKGDDLSPAVRQQLLRLADIGTRQMMIGNQGTEAAYYRRALKLDQEPAFALDRPAPALALTPFL